MLNIPSRDYSYDGVGITRYYNTSKEIYGGKEYIDVFDDSFDMLDNEKKQAFLHYVETLPKSLY